MQDRSKIGTVEEETDDSLYPMELNVKKGLMKAGSHAGLYRETNEISAIVVASIKTDRKKA